MTETELKKKPKWDLASRILACGIEDGTCTGHSVAFVRLIESGNQSDNNKEHLWLCQTHFSMLLKQEEEQPPEASRVVESELLGCTLTVKTVEGGMQYLPITWSPLEPGLNEMATSLEAECLCGGWRLISRAEGSQYASRTHSIDPPVEDAIPVRRRDGWYWQIVEVKQ